MTVNRVFQVGKESRNINDIFNELVRSNIDFILKSSYPENKMNTVASQKGQPSWNNYFLTKKTLNKVSVPFKKN